MNIHLDISQLIQDPRRSGIQRSERELIRHWPGPARLVPCRFDATTMQMQELPHAVLEILCDDAPDGGVRAELARLQPHLCTTKVVMPDRLLSAELFLDPLRAAYYRHSRSRTFWLVYDFLPWLDPDWFGTGAAVRLMPYLQCLRSVGSLAFISARTRDDCSARILRRPCEGPVIPMGGDGLGLEKQGFDPVRRNFVMLGTIEQRKNAAPAMRAFRELWREGADAPLVMIGATSPDASDELELLGAMAADHRFRHLRNLSDAGVRDELRHARALVFPSEGEGFGIPPMEALHAGVPVIVSAGLPAIAGRPDLGQIRLSAITPNTIASAVRVLLDDAAAARLWADASRLHVAGWAEFARGIADWVQA